ncbi:MAG: segregation and condensation protein A [Opitutales bacterium]
MADSEVFAPRQRHPIQLASFEGPLDLLLFLIRRNELDIYDIPIEEVTRQYLEVLHAMERLDLEVAGDFFVMAATLMYIKSRLLLPPTEEDAEEEEEDDELDPRWELVQQLLEYKKFKEAARALRERIMLQQDMLSRHYKEPAEAREPRPLKPSDRLEIWNTFNNLLRRLQERIGGEIHDEQLTTADQMEAILKLASRRARFIFDDLLPPYGQVGINFLVTTLLALLELARLKHLWLLQEEVYGQIHIEVRDPNSTDEAELAPQEPGD